MICIIWGSFPIASVGQIPLFITLFVIIILEQPGIYQDSSSSFACLLSFFKGFKWTYRTLHSVWHIFLVSCALFYYIISNHTCFFQWCYSPLWLQIFTTGTEWRFVIVMVPLSLVMVKIMLDIYFCWLIF